MPVGPTGNQNQITATMSEMEQFCNCVSESLVDLSAINTASI